MNGDTQRILQKLVALIWYVNQRTNRIFPRKLLFYALTLFSYTKICCVVVVPTGGNEGKTFERPSDNGGKQCIIFSHLYLARCMKLTLHTQ